MADTYEIFSLDDIVNNDTRDIVDENVTDVAEEEVRGKLHLAETDELINLGNEIETVDNAVMMPVNGMVMDLSETEMLCDEQGVEDITEETYDKDISDTITEIDGTVEDIATGEIPIVTGDTEIDGLVEDMDVADIPEEIADMPAGDYAGYDGAEICGEIADEAVLDDVSDSSDEIFSLDTVEETNGNITFSQGMTIPDFLRANPNVRTRDILEQYFSVESVTKALRSGVIMCMHGEISL